MGYLGKALVGGMMIPLLPINRVVEQAQAQMSDESGAAAEAEGGDLTSCDYWRYCGFDGYLCSCCGGALTSCPPGTAASPTSWVGTCQHPTDGKEYIIAYRDCCGKDVCNRCFCDNNNGQVPIYRGRSWITTSSGVSGRRISPITAPRRSGWASRPDVAFLTSDGRRAAFRPRVLEMKQREPRRCAAPAVLLAQSNRGGPINRGRRAAIARASRPWRDRRRKSSRR